MLVIFYVAAQVPAYLMRNKLRIAEEQQQLETFMKLREQPVSGHMHGLRGWACTRWAAMGFARVEGSIMGQVIYSVEPIHNKGLHAF